MSADMPDFGNKGGPVVPKWNSEGHRWLKVTLWVCDALKCSWELALAIVVIYQLDGDQSSKPISTYNMLAIFATQMVVVSLHFVWRFVCSLVRMCQVSRTTAVGAYTNATKAGAGSAWPPGAYPLFFYFLYCANGVVVYTLYNYAFQKTNDGDALFGSNKYNVMQTVEWLTVVQISAELALAANHYSWKIMHHIRSRKTGCCGSTGGGCCGDSAEGI